MLDPMPSKYVSTDLPPRVFVFAKSFVIELLARLDFPLSVILEFPLFYSPAGNYFLLCRSRSIFSSFHFAFAKRIHGPRTLSYPSLKLQCMSGTYSMSVEATSLICPLARGDGVEIFSKTLGLVGLPSDINAFKGRRPRSQLVENGPHNSGLGADVFTRRNRKTNFNQHQMSSGDKQCLPSVLTVTTKPICFGNRRIAWQSFATCWIFSNLGIVTEKRTKF